MAENPIHSYLTKVMKEIKSHEARSYVSSELSYHIIEAKNKWKDKGFSDEEAEEKAILQMGEPAKLGKSLNKIHKPKVDWYMLILVMGALGLGFLPLFVLGDHISTVNLVETKVISVLLGLIVIISFMLFDYRRLRKFGWVFYIIGTSLLVALQLFAGQFVNGSPIIPLGPFTIEGKLALPFLFIAWASFYSSEKFKLWQMVLLFVIPLYYYFTLPMIATAYIYCVMVMVMLAWSTFPRKTTYKVWGAFIIVVLTLVSLSWTVMDYYQKRRFVSVFYTGDADANYVLTLLKEQLLQAGWFGNPDAHYVPDPHTNFVFVSLTAHYGWLFGIMILLVLSLLVLRMVAIFRTVNEPFTKLLLAGAIGLIATQLISNILMSVGVFPSTTMSLPFISYGLMPIVLNGFIVGMVLSIYRRKHIISHYTRKVD